MKLKQKCRKQGCESMTSGSTGFCYHHFRNSAVCVYPDCTNATSTRSLYRHCPEHYKIGHEQARMKWVGIGGTHD